MTESRKPPLSFSLSSDWLRGVLRVDRIRQDALYQLGQSWAEDDGREDVTGALDALAELTVGSPTPEELDVALDALDDAGCTERPEIRITLDDALRMRAELDVVIARLGRFGSPVAVPQQREGGAAA